MLNFHHEAITVGTTQRNRLGHHHIFENTANLNANALHLQIREFRKIQGVDESSMDAEPQVLKDYIRACHLKRSERHPRTLAGASIGIPAFFSDSSSGFFIVASYFINPRTGGSNLPS